MAAGFDPIATSGTQTYTITVDNLGPQDATNIRVRDTLPAGTMFRTAPGDHGFTCSHAAASSSASAASHPGHGQRVLPARRPRRRRGDDHRSAIFARPIVRPTMHNEVRVDPNNEIAEVNESNNFAFQDTNVDSGGAPMGAFNELTIDEDRPRRPRAARAASVPGTRRSITQHRDRSRGRRDGPRLPARRLRATSEETPTGRSAPSCARGRATSSSASGGPSPEHSTC